MVDYFCSKCNKTVSSTTDLYMDYNKRCRFCSEILEPKQRPIRKDFDNINIKERRKEKGEIWEIHKNDKDPFPSNPHAHNIETGEKLDLNNGNIYDSRTGNVIRKMKNKDLESLKSKFNEENFK